MFELTITERTIDIQEVIRQKAPGLYRKLPGFVFPLLRKLLHEEEINRVLYKEKDKVGIEFADAVLENFGCQVSVQGTENIEKGKRYIFCANHPLGGLDGIAMISKIGSLFPDVRFPVNDMLLALPPLKPVFLPISKLQKNTGNRRSLEEAFQSDATLLYFPAGMCSRKQKGKILDLEWKKTFVTQARNSHRDIVPVYISGKNSNFFYNLANLRTRLGLKANIEQAFLVNEMFKQKDQEICLTIGRPIASESLTKDISDKEWASRIKEHVYHLASNPISDFSL